MNCAECQELLVADLEGLLETAQKQAVADHLKTCPACRTEFEGMQVLRQRLVSRGKVLAQDSVEDEVMNRIIREQSARLKAAAQAGTGLRLRRLIMKSSIVKIAVAAVVVLAVAGALSLWTGTKSGVALADVVAKVEQVQAFMCKMTAHVKTSMEGIPPAESDVQATMLGSHEYGMKMEMTTTNSLLGQGMTQEMYMLPQQKMIVTVLPSLKQYARMELDDATFEKKMKENNDPRRMLKKLLDGPYTDLGQTVLDGVEVQGFQTNDAPQYSGIGDVDVKVWVNMKTEMPIRMDMKIKMSDQVQMEGTLHDFQWDIPVSAADFNPVIPADYTAAVTDGMKMPPMTEETAVAGLRLCIELIGKYPDDLNLMSLMQTAAKATQNNPAFKPAENHPPANPAISAEEQQKKMKEQVNEMTKKMMDKLMPLQALGGFYVNLVQEKKDPAYYGKIVKPGDAAQVLLRWKTADDQYRVIFGDLHAITVDGDTVRKLEAALPK